MGNDFVTSLPAQAAARCIIDTAKSLDLLDGPLNVAPELAEREKALFLAMFSAMEEHRREHGDQLSADEICSLFTYVFAKAAEIVTDFYNHQTGKVDFSGMFDGRIPICADESITAEFKSSPFPAQCAHNYLQWVENDAAYLTGCDMRLLLFEALKWCFRLSCHLAVEIVSHKAR